MRIAAHSSATVDRFWSPVALLFLLIAVASGQQYSYTRDCNDQQHKEIQCSVQLVDCDNETALPQVTDSALVPAEAHDIRVEPFAKAMSRRQSGDSYQLSVDISWQTPPHNSTKLLKGFFLEIESVDAKQHLCFLFNVAESNWTATAISASPRLHFSTESLFRFGQNYDVTVHSLPLSTKISRSAHKQVAMPHNPRLPNHSNLLSPNCSQFSHPFASKWTAGFRRIILHSLARTIQIEFVGAPAQYCFEQYEVRLLDETGLELLHSDILSVDQMSRETIDNQTVFFGQYNFTNLDLDRSYIPSVIAVERAADGRCLCPVYGTDPYDNTVVCSCIAADWKVVKLQKLSPKQPVFNESVVPKMSVEMEDSTSGSLLYVLLVLAIFAVLACVAFLFLTAYRHYVSRGKTVRIRFIQDRSRSSAASHSQSKALLENGLSGAPVLLSSGNLNLLLVYAHDSPQHDAAVFAFADFLHEAFGFDVHLDRLDEEKIERNLMDYLSSSVVNADKILVVNSLGSVQRYQTKIQNNSTASEHFIVERSDPTHFDSLFVSQIDMVLQHHCIVSVRFDYSQFGEVLPPLQSCLQYVLPANLAPLMSALSSNNLKTDPRLTGYNPQLAKLNASIDAVRQMIAADGQWFARTHHRRRVAPRLSATVPNAIVPTILPTVTTSVDLDEEKMVLVASEGTTSEEEDQFSTSSREIVPMIAATGRLPIGDETEPTDSGVYDDCRLDSKDQSALITQSNESIEEKPIEERISAQTHLPPAKWPSEQNADSGVVSDADLQMISAS